MGAGSVQPGKGWTWGILLASTNAQKKRKYGGRLLRESQLQDDRQQFQVDIKQF